MRPRSKSTQGQRSASSSPGRCGVSDTATSEEILPSATRIAALDNACVVLIRRDRPVALHRDSVDKSAAGQSRARSWLSARAAISTRDELRSGVELFVCLRRAANCVSGHQLGLPYPASPKQLRRRVLCRAALCQERISPAERRLVAAPKAKAGATCGPVAGAEHRHKLMSPASTKAGVSSLAVAVWP
jgi:hypothetical protein